MKGKEIIINILNNEYKVIVCWGDSKYVNKILTSWHHDKQDMEDHFKTKRGMTFYKQDRHPVIALPKRPTKPDEIATLSHEAVHAVFNIFDKIDERSYDEVFAHSVGAVVRQVLNYKSK